MPSELKDTAPARFVPAALEHVSPRACDVGNSWDASMSPEETQRLGEQLYPLVCKHGLDEPEVVTGMLLELPRSEIEGLLTASPDLALRIAECQRALQDRNMLSAHHPPCIDPEPILRELHALVSFWSQSAGQLQHASGSSNVHLYLYGSCSLGVATPDSDVDILVAVPKHICRVRHFFGIPVCKPNAARSRSEAPSTNDDSLMGILRQDKRVHELMAVPDAYVPCIKLRFDGVAVDLTFANLGLASLPAQAASRANWTSGIDCITAKNLPDLACDAPSLRSVSGVRATRALLELVPDVAIFRQTLRLVKSWAKLRGIYGNTVGFWGGMSWAILTAKVCQEFPSHSTEHTLALFYRVFVSWQWPTPVRLKPVKAECETCRLLDSFVWDPVKNPLDARHLMPILTPGHPSMNSTFNTGPCTFRVLKSEFERGALVANAGAVLAVPPMMEMLLRSARTYFFSRYTRYVRLDVIAPDAERHRRWVGLVQALLRHLVRMLESSRQCFVHPWPHSEIILEGSNAHQDVCICSYFIGVVDLHSADRGTAMITDAVAEFRRLVIMRSAGWYESGMVVSEQIMLRDDLSHSILGSPLRSLTQCDDPVPPRNVDASDFCSCVDEQQMQAWETAIIARSSGIDAGNVQRLIWNVSDAERSATAEIKTAHETMLATCEGLTRQLTVAIGQASRDRQTTEERQRDRVHTLQQIQSLWRDEKKELEADLDNVRAALKVAEVKATDAAKCVRVMKATLSREAALKKDDADILDAAKREGKHKADKILPLHCNIQPCTTIKKQQQRSQPTLRLTKGGKRRKITVHAHDYGLLCAIGFCTISICCAAFCFLTSPIAEECSSTACLNGASCIKLQQGTKCKCVHGYSGHHCETLINIRDASSTATWWDNAASVGSNDGTSLCPGPCYNGGECVRSRDESIAHLSLGQCVCKEGFAGAKCENPVEECDSSPCLHGATCVDAVGRYVCICTGEWCGALMGVVIISSLSSCCRRGPECQFARLSHRRDDCKQGNMCEHPNDDCASSPCLNGASCTSQMGSFTCLCRGGFHGENCAETEGPRDSNPCNFGDVGSAGMGTYLCETPSTHSSLLAMDPSFDWVGTKLAHDQPLQLLDIGYVGNEHVPDLATEACADARALHSRGKFAAAAAKYADAIQAGHPDLALLHNERAISLARSGDFEGASDDNALAIALDPAIAAQNNLASRIEDIQAAQEL